MPAKKGDKKTRKKKTTKPKVTKKKVVKKKVKKNLSAVTQKTKAEIKEATNKIPGLIFEQVEFKSEAKTPSTPPPAISKRPQYNDAGEKTKRTLMWLGVIILTAIVFAMWIWNTNSFMKDVNLHQQSKTNLWGQAKADWQKTKNEEVKNNLAKVLPTATNTNELEVLPIATSTANTSTSELKTLPTTTNTEKLKTTLKQALLNLIASSTPVTASSTTSTLE